MSEIIYGWVLLSSSGIRQWSTFTTIMPSNLLGWERTFRVMGSCALECGVGVSYEEDQELYPKCQEVNIEGIGYVNFSLSIQDTPIKVILKYNGGIIFDSGYVGDTADQGDLNTWFLQRGYPIETISPGIDINYSFYKPAFEPKYLKILIYSPLAGNFDYVVTCPGTTTTSTSTSSTSSSSSSSTSSSSTSSSSSSSSSTSSSTSSTTLAPQIFKIVVKNNSSNLFNKIVLHYANINDGVTYDNSVVELLPIGSETTIYTGTLIDLNEPLINFDLQVTASIPAAWNLQSVDPAVFYNPFVNSDNVSGFLDGSGGSGADHIIANSFNLGQIPVSTECWLYLTLID